MGTSDSHNPATDFADLSAVFLNCTLTPSPGFSHTEALMDRAAEIMREQGVEVETIRVADHDVPAGVQEDMTEHGFEADDWPELQRRVLAADILVIGTPIWLGVKSSIATKVIERLYGYSGELNDEGQSIYYGRAAGVVVTGNEDGVKAVAMETLYALSHLGYVIPPQADCGWIGEIGPGPSYGDDDGDGGLIGVDSEFTRRNTRIMCWNLMHLARMMRAAGGIPAEGNTRE